MNDTDRTNIDSIDLTEAVKQLPPADTTLDLDGEWSAEITDDQARRILEDED